MRLIWVLILVVAVCFLVSLLWKEVTTVSSPPGQYPLNEERPTWSSVQSVGYYRPMQPEGPPPSAKDAKFRCGTANTCPAEQQTVSLSI